MLCPCLSSQCRGHSSQILTLPCLRRSVPCHAFAVRCISGAKLNITMLSLLCTAHCLFSANLSYTVAMQCFADALLCPAAPCHSCAHQCRRFALPRDSMPVHVTSMPLHLFACASPCFAGAALCLAMPLRRCAWPRLSSSSPRHATAYPFHGFARLSPCFSTLCPCAACPRHALPGRSFSIPRLLCAHPCHDHALLSLRVATQSQSSSQHCPSVPLPRTAHLCQSFG